MGILTKTNEGYKITGGFNTTNKNDMKQLLDEATKVISAKFRNDKTPKKVEIEVETPDSSWKKAKIEKWIMDNKSEEEEIKDGLTKKELLKIAGGMI